MPSFAELKVSREARYPQKTEQDGATGSLVSASSGTPDSPIPPSVSSSSQTGIQPNAPEVDDHLRQPPRKEGDALNDMYSLSGGLRVRQTNQRGRGLFAEKRFTPGSTIASVSPLIAAVSTGQLRSCCSNCFLSPHEISILSARGERVKALNRCVSCKVVYYCSQSCQREDWTAHKDECRAHTRLKELFLRTQEKEDGEWVQSESVRALGRLCWARKREMNGGGDAGWWKQVGEMESHLSRITDQDRIRLAQQVQHLRHYLTLGTSTFGKEPEPEPVDMADYGFTSAGELLHLHSAIVVNSFTLSSPSLSPIGVAMSTAVALANHSCEPNAVVIFPEGRKKGVSIVAISEIQPDQEILTSYIDVSLPFSERQADLQARYRFKCDCPLCQKEVSGWADPRWAARHADCRKSKGKARMPGEVLIFSKEKRLIRGAAGLKHGGDGKCEATCESCGETIRINISAIRSAIDKGKAILKQDEAGTLDLDKARDTLSSLLPTLMAAIPPSSHPLLALLRLNALLHSPPTSPVSMNICLSSLANAYAGAQMVYPLGHPTLAIISAEWGKLLAVEAPPEWGEQTRMGVARRLEQAVTVLRKAVEACERGFGRGGGVVGKEMEGLLRGCDGELGLMRNAR